MKLCWLLDKCGEVVSWSRDTANVHNQVFLLLVADLEEESIVLVDTIFNVADCHLKKVFHHTHQCFQSRLAYMIALFIVVLGLNRYLAPNADQHDRLCHFAQVVL